MFRRELEFSNSDFAFIEHLQDLIRAPVRCCLGVTRELGHFLKIIGERQALANDDRSIVGGELILGLEPFAPCRRQLGQFGFQTIQPGLLYQHRHQIGLGEITVIRSLLFAPLHHGYALVLVPTRGGFRHLTQFLVGQLVLFVLPLGFVGHGPLDGAETVEIFYLDNRRGHVTITLGNVNVDIGIYP
ncbi:hypothetical protein HRbin36_02875 [bacterium HR36]|nr:hypothetical protein HRbin36_02875 [bacterium HR36]